LLKRIDHVGVVVDDLERVSRLLTDVLGLELRRTLEDPGRALRARFYRCGEVDIELIELGDPQERAGRLGDVPARIDHIAIEVEDLAGTATDLGEKGIRMSTPRPRVAAGASSYFTQPDSSGGVVLQFLERTQGA